MKNTVLESHKMKSCNGITLILLGLCIQASATANTTQSYYFELRIESSAFENFTWLLGNITEFTVGNARLTDIAITTDCQNQNCTCATNYSWNETVCKMHPECCPNNTCRIDGICLHKNRVYIDGSFTIQNKFYDDQDKIQKMLLTTELTTNLTMSYSTMNWFDSLQITSLRSGSIIGDFVMLINGPFDMNQFVKMTEDLQTELQANFTIITTGFIKIEAPVLIGYDKNTEIICTTPVDTLKYVKWYIQKDSSIQRITKGTEANVIQGLTTSTVSIIKTSDVWKGTFICDYTSGELSSIIHRASVFLDVALLPKIFITSNPQFPNCRGKPKRTILVNLMCITDNSKEPYRVTWFLDNPTIAASEQNSTTYKKNMYINCAENQEQYVAKCSFTNRADNTRNASLTIQVIKDDSVVCPASDGWPEAKANYTATMLCNPNEVGNKLRDCTGSQNPGTWKQIDSRCVNTDILALLTEAQNLQKGCGLVKDNANKLFNSLKQESENPIINTFQNIYTSVNVLDTLNYASEIQNSSFNESILTDFLKSSSNLLNNSLLKNWQSAVVNNTLPNQYLKAVEGVVNRIKITMDKPHKEENLQLIICNKSVETCEKTFNITFDPKTNGTVYQTKIKNLPNLLPKYYKATYPSDFIMSITSETNLSKIYINFPNQRLPNHEIFCVFFDITTDQWSNKGCVWGGAHEPDLCMCNHLSAYTSLMSRHPVELKYMNEISLTGLGFSICSLVLYLAIEFLVWNTVVKSNISHFRHTVLVNISLCLLIAHCSFIASSLKNSAFNQWCLAFTIMKHFCFLAVFFWMLCMSMGLLHQMIFVFVQLRKKVYLGLCFFLGYICPLFIVICTVITYNNGAINQYYVEETCWLKYESVLKGSIHSFVFPVGIIVLVNMFIMVVVISRILKPTLSEGKSHDEKEIVRSVIRTVVLLTPTLGITWIFGLGVLMVDLTMNPFAQIVNYAFAFFNSFQGFFILLTGCFGEKKVRDALLMRIRSQHSAHYTSKSSMKMTAAVKKK